MVNGLAFIDPFKSSYSTKTLVTFTYSHTCSYTGGSEECVTLLSAAIHTYSTLTHRWLCIQGKYRVRYVAQGHFNTLSTEDRTVDPLIMDFTWLIFKTAYQLVTCCAASWTHAALISDNLHAERNVCRMHHVYANVSRLTLDLGGQLLMMGLYAFTAPVIITALTVKQKNMNWLYAATVIQNELTFGLKRKHNVTLLLRKDTKKYIITS